RLDRARVARVQAQLALGVRLLEHLAVPLPLRDRHIALAATQALDRVTLKAGPTIAEEVEAISY
ncbi:MAG: hypothetical protein ACRDM0_14055, partial [Thermoleophilaceae bacterium]